jgi:hypothetical protein
MNSNFKIQLYKDEDYNTVKEWYIKRNIPPLAPELITCPSIFVTDSDGNKLLLLIVYVVENAPVASIAFSVGNPECKPKIMYQAMDRGLNGIIYICEKQGIKLLFSQLARFSKSKLLDKYFFFRGAKSVWERFRVWK